MKSGTASPTVRKIVIHGWYGNGNLGDEIILAAMLRDLGRDFPTAKFTIITKDPEETSRIHRVRSIGSGGTMKERLRRFREIAGADLFILGGGGILGSYGSSDRALLAWLAPLRLAQELGVPTMTWGVGVGDRISSREAEALKRVLGSTDAICLRDMSSVEHLGQLGVNERVVLTADPAILFPEGTLPRRSPREDGASPRVSVFVRHWYVSEDRVKDEAQWKEFKRSLAACLDSLVSKSARVSFIPMRIKDPIDDDRDVAGEVAEAMAHGGLVKNVDHLLSPSELIWEIVQSDLVIGMRLHSLVLAAALGVPLIAIDYHPKVRGFMDSLGIPDWSFEIKGESGSRLTGAVETALAGSYPQDTVRAHVEVTRGLARKNLETASRLLNLAASERGRVSKGTRMISVVASRLASLRRSQEAN